MMDKEYDAFGPWIYEINDEHPMPDLFKPYYKRSENHLFLAKIPVNAERRTLKPGMNMYDYVIGAYDRDILIMSRDASEVSVKTINYGEILTIEHTVNLLKGTIRIVTVDDEFLFSYNTVSEEMMHSFMDIIRERYTDSKKKGPSMNRGEDESSLSFHFLNVLEHERKSNPELIVVGHEKTSTLSFIDRSFLKRTVEVILKPTLMEKMFCTDGRELFIISTDRDITFRHVKHPGIKYSYMPFSSIEHVDTTADTRYQGVNSFSITLKNGFTNTTLCSSACSNTIISGMFSGQVH